MEKQDMKKGVPGDKERSALPPEQRARQNWPIENGLRVKRVYQREPIDETCWAYMKLLRETSGMRRVYDVDPYAEVYRFRENVYGILVESLDGMGDAWIYLVVGPERAMLIDTGFGLGDLKGLAQQLAGGKELIVVNTHGHFDHAYGNCQFDRVYCHEYEAPSLLGQNSGMWDYLFDESDGRGIWAEFDRGELVPFKKYEVVPCRDGHIFDLGDGYEIELVFLGGHSAGHAGYLDRRGRNFFAGDDIISMRVGVNGPKPGQPFGEFATVSTLRDNLEHLAGRLNEFDHVFTGHFVTDLESSAVENMLKACSEAVKYPERCAYSAETEKGTQYFKYVEGLGCLAYRMDSL